MQKLKDLDKVGVYHHFPLIEGGFPGVFNVGLADAEQLGVYHGFESLAE
jgi:hypothetical protein